MNVDFNKVKKSPIPKDATNVVSYFRGDGIKILVFDSGAMQVRDENGSVLSHRASSSYTADTPTGEVKKMAAAMLANEQRKKTNMLDALDDVDFEESERTADLSVPKVNTPSGPMPMRPAFRQTFGFLTSGRTVLA